MFLIITILFISLVKTVSAAEVCCEKIIDKDLWCLNADENQCDISDSLGVSPNKCSATTFCEPGWCFTPVKGYCEGSTKAACEYTQREFKGEWTKEKGERCEKGCCHLGLAREYVTKTTCDDIGPDYGIRSPEWNKGESEEACKFYTEEQGACVYEGGCTWTTERECYTDKNGIDFKTEEGVFCSNEELENEYGYDYKENSSKVCYNDDIYWQDNQKNRGGIVEDCEEKMEICDINSAGEYYCKKTTCIDGTKTRVNTESWCVYDAYVGDSKDYVGSEHCKLFCANGKIKLERCTENRQEVCSEKIDLVTGVSTAQLRENLWAECLDIDNVAECIDNPDCRIQSVNVDDYFKFDTCVPKYPPLGENNKEMCGLASMDCIHIKDDDGWFRGADDDMANGKCSSAIFPEQMHSLCTSLGDCGSYFNYIGNYTYNDDLSWYYAEIARCQEVVKRFGYWNIFSLKCSNYLANSNGVGDQFLKTGGDFPQWLRLTQKPDSGIPESLVLINAKMPDDFTYDGDFDRMDEIYSFTCSPWKKPVGGDYCSKCNENSLIKCSPYRCENLGSACGILVGTESTDNPICIDRFSKDIKPPEISFGSISSEYKVVKGTNGVSISLADGTSCPLKFNTVSFTLKTDEDATCKTYVSGTLEVIKNEGENYNRIHEINEVNLGVDDKLRLLTVCVDPAGNPNINEYIVDICISPRPDIQAPVIKKYIPETGSYIAFGETKKMVTLKLDEPVICRYATTPSIPYENMAYFCISGIEGIGPYSCSTEIKNLVNPQNDIYIKCNDTVGNINSEDNLYTLFATRENLKINIRTPVKDSVKETPIDRNNPLIIEVETIGGAYEGDSDCTYNFLGLAWKDRFFKTGEKIHRQEFTSEDAFTERDYNVEIKCNDIAGNEAKTVLHFTLDIDNQPPKVISNKKEGENFIFETDEEAWCYYRTGVCPLKLDENSTETDPTGFKIGHTIPNLDPSLDYYITCEDIWENKNCSHKILATENDDGNLTQVVRVYRNASTNKLVVVTDKKAVCSYSTDSCNFEIEGSELKTTHSFTWGSPTYYIRCKDRFGEKPEGCTIVVKANQLIT